MTFQVINIETATRKFPKRINVVATFETKALAEAWRRREDPRSQISSGIRETPKVQAPLVLGFEEVGEPRGSALTPRDIARRNLGKQAIEKAEAGIPISQAERDAARKLTGTNIQTIKETKRLSAALRGEKDLILKVTPVPERIRDIAERKAAERKAAQLTLVTRGRSLIDIGQISRPTLETGGLPLTFLGIPKTLKIEKTEFGLAQERGIFPSLRLIGATGLETLTQTAEDIRGGVLGFVEEFGRGIIERPIGKIDTGLEEITRGVSLEGKTLFERRRKIEGEEVLFPVVPETLAKGVRGVESALEFVFEDVPKGIKAGGEFVISKEGREAIFDIGKVAAKELKVRPIETLTAAGTIGSLALFDVIGTTAKEFRKAPVFISTEAAAFGEVFRVGGAAFKPFKTKVRKIKFERKISKFEKRITETGLDFELRPFVAEFEKPPKFLQATLGGEVLDPEKLRFLLSEPPKISRAEAQRLDIFRPEIETGILKDISLGGLGKKETQLQLRRSFPTAEQEAIAFFRQLPRKKPPKQLDLFDVFKGKKGQAQLFKPSEILGDIRIFERGGRIERPKPIFKIEIDTIFKPSKRAGAFDFRTPAIFGKEGIDQIFDQKQIQKGALAFGAKAIQRQFQETASLLKIDQMPFQIPDFDIAAETGFRTDQELRTDKKLKLVTETDLDLDIDLGFDKTIDTDFFEEPEPKKTKLPLGFGLDLDFPKEERGQAFNVFAREKGQLVKLNTEPLLRTRAKNLGADIVDHSASASFILKKTTGKVKSFIDDPFFFSAGKFRSPATKSKLPPKTFIERNMFRIDTAGELKGITAKGLLAQRRKRIKDNFFGINLGGL